MNPELVKEIVKGGVAVILSVGMVWILHTAVSEDEASRSFLHEHMSRQTEALETLVRIYSGAGH